MFHAPRVRRRGVGVRAAISVLVAVACAGCSAGVVTPPAAPTTTVQSVTVTGVTAAVTTGQSGALVATATMSDGSSSVVTTQATWECTISGWHWATLGSREYDQDHRA